MGLNELIWYSVSGAFWVGAIIVKYPHWTSNQGRAFILTASVPIVGFVVHELYRNVFEGCFDGFACESRRSLECLWNTIASKVGYTVKNKYRKSFLIWETTFYDKEIPEDIRKHDRASWHYIIAFESGALNAVLAAILLVVWGAIDNDVLDSQKICRILVFIAVSLITAVVLLIKANLSFDKLMREEEAMIVRYPRPFRRTAIRLLPLNGSLDSTGQKNVLRRVCQCIRVILNKRSKTRRCGR